MYYYMNIVCTCVAVSRCTYGEQKKEHVLLPSREPPLHLTHRPSLQHTGILYVDQADLKLRDPSAFSFRVLVLRACPTMSGGPQFHLLETSLADAAQGSLELMATMPQPFRAGITCVHTLFKLLKFFTYVL